MTISGKDMSKKDKYEVSRNYFSDTRKYEVTCRFLLFLSMASIAIILFFYRDFLAMQRLIEPLFNFQARQPVVEYLFRAITFLGDDEFYMIFLSVLLWSFHKSIGFWTAVVLLLSGAYTFYLKDLFGVPRPDFGIEQPGNDSFPSGHTLTAFTVWGYLAVRLRSTPFWIFTVPLIILMGFSRMILGYHFVADILAGLLFGFIFLALFVWISAIITEKEWSKKLTFPALLAISLAIPIILTIILPDDITRLMGYLAGISIGFVLEREKIRYITEAKWYKHILRALLGVAVMFAIVAGLSGLLPTSITAAGFARYALAGFWVTFAAPFIFTRIGLADTEQ